MAAVYISDHSLRHDASWWICNRASLLQVFNRSFVFSCLPAISYAVASRHTLDGIFSSKEPIAPYHVAVATSRATDFSPGNQWHYNRSFTRRYSSPRRLRSYLSKLDAIQQVSHVLGSKAPPGQDPGSRWHPPASPREQYPCSGAAFGSDKPSRTNSIYRRRLQHSEWCRSSGSCCPALRIEVSGKLPCVGGAGGEASAIMFWRVPNYDPRGRPFLALQHENQCCASGTFPVHFQQLFLCFRHHLYTPTAGHAVDRRVFF